MFSSATSRTEEVGIQQGRKGWTQCSDSQGRQNDMGTRFQSSTLWACGGAKLRTVTSSFGCKVCFLRIRQADSLRINIFLEGKTHSGEASPKFISPLWTIENSSLSGNKPHKKEPFLQQLITCACLARLLSWNRLVGDSTVGCWLNVERRLSVIASRFTCLFWHETASITMLQGNFEDWSRNYDMLEWWGSLGQARQLTSCIDGKLECASHVFHHNRNNNEILHHVFRKRNNILFNIGCHYDNFNNSDEIIWFRE